ncbi:MAG: hypothetical protein IK111_10675 [Lachnospiraceae bacterium]|nr:hypothetical protein [Lachnospiraceae bacterium]
MIKKKLVKKTAALAITGALTIAMTATVLAAPGGRGGNEGNGGRGPSQEMQQGGGVPGEEFTGERPEMPEMPDGEEFTGERPEPPEMPDGEEFTGERPEIPEMPELPEGEESSEERPEMSNGKGGRGGRMKAGKDFKGINTDDIKTSIETLEDEDVKADIEALLSDYEAAKTALDNAIEEESDDIETYRKAEMEAMKALCTALEEAGIDTRPELPEGEECENGKGSNESEEGEKRQRNKESLDQSQEKTSEAEGANTAPGRPGMQQNASSEGGREVKSDNIFVKFGNWLKSLFSR